MPCHVCKRGTGTRLPDLIGPPPLFSPITFISYLCNVLSSAPAAAHGLAALCALADEDVLSL